MKANLCYFRCTVWGYVNYREIGARLHEGEPVLFQVPLYGQALTDASKGINILLDFPRKYLTQGRVWHSRVLRCRVTKEANLCYFRSRFLASRELQWNRNTFA